MLLRAQNMTLLSKVRRNVAKAKLYDSWNYLMPSFTEKVAPLFSQRSTILDVVVYIYEKLLRQYNINLYDIFFAIRMRNEGLCRIVTHSHHISYHLNRGFK